MSRPGPADDRIVIPTSEQPVVEPPSRRRSGFPWLLVIAVLSISWLVFELESPLDWVSGDAPQRFLNAESVVATPGGFSMLAGPEGAGGVVWTTSDGERWLSRSLPRLGARVVYHSTGLFVVDGRSISVVGPDGDDPPVVVALPDPVRIGSGSDRPGLVSALGGLVAQTITGDVYFAPDGRAFEQAVRAEEWRATADVTLLPSSILGVPPPRVRSVCQPIERRAPDIVPIVNTGSAAYAFVPENDPSIAWPVCEPVVWITADGLEWSQRQFETAFPARAYISDVDWRDGRFVAVGGVGLDAPMAWTSRDAETWEPIDLEGLDDNTRLVDVHQGGIGWLIVGSPRNDSGRTAWFSSDGVCFQSVPTGVIGLGSAVGDEAIISVGRSPDPEVWVARPDSIGAVVGGCRP